MFSSSTMSVSGSMTRRAGDIDGYAVRGEDGETRRHNPERTSS